MRPRILFFSTLSAPPYWGGSEKYWYDAVLDPRFRGALDCRVMLRESEATRRVADRLRAAGVEVGWCRPADGILGRIGKRIGRMRRRAERKGYETWYHEIGRLRPDLVWFNLSHIGAVADLGYATALCGREGLPYWLILQHAHDHYFPADEAKRARFERVVAGAARVVCVSRHNRRVLELAAGRRPAQRPDGHQRRDPRLRGTRAADAADASPVRADGTARLLCLARLKFENKGQHRLLEALSGRPWAGRDWRLRLVGGGPHAAQVARLVDYYGIARGRVEVCGHRDDVIAEVADSDLLVMPSLSEAGPYVMVEAMACGRPAVGTPVGRIPELVAEGRTGWLAESTEAPHLAAALERAWSDRRVWPRYGAEARARVAAGFDLDGTLPPLVDALRHDARRAGTSAGISGPLGAGARMSRRPTGGATKGGGTGVALTEARAIRDHGDPHPDLLDHGRPRRSPVLGRLGEVLVRRRAGPAVPGRWTAGSCSARARRPGGSPTGCASPGVEVGWCRPAGGILGRVGKHAERLRGRRGRRGMRAGTTRSGGSAPTWSGST